MTETKRGGKSPHTNRAVCLDYLHLDPTRCPRRYAALVKQGQKFQDSMSIAKLSSQGPTETILTHHRSGSRLSLGHPRHLQVELPLVVSKLCS